MCGIAGVRRFGDKPILPVELDSLLTSMEYRGLDACGIATQQADGQVAIYKNNDKAWQFVHSKGYQAYLDEWLREDTVCAMIHTRKATKGTPYKAENNHPLFHGHAAIVHNGQVNNDDALFREMDLERHAETDSDVIRAMIDKFGVTPKAIEKLNRLAGTVAAACIHPDAPGKLLLLRSGNPLVVASSEKLGKLYWASDRRAIFRAAKPWVRRWGIEMQLAVPDLAFINLAEDSGWIIGPEGLEFHGEFRAIGHGGRGYLNYQVYSGDWKERQEKFRKEAEPTCARKWDVATDLKTGELKSDYASPEFVLCPNPSCVNPQTKMRTFIRVAEHLRKLPLWRIQCRRCKQNLGIDVEPQRIN